MTHHRQPGTAGRLAQASSRAFVTRGVLQSRDERHRFDLLWAAPHANEPPAFQVCGAVLIAPPRPSE
jgi:hypothetical protein